MGEPDLRGKLSVVVPVFNERATIGVILGRVLARPEVGEVIVVDDCSTDGTKEILSADWHAEHRVRLVFQERNRGKGAAVRRGIAMARLPVTIIQDADLEYDPADFPRLMAPIVRGDADAVYGSRFLGDERRVLLFWHSIGNWFLTTLSNALTNLNLTDMETGYKAFRTRLIQAVEIESERFGFEPEVTAKLSRVNARIFEVPISYRGREYWQGKKIGWRDGIEAFRTMVRFALKPETSAGKPGAETLDRLTTAGSYNRWILDRTRPYLGKRVLEVGSGIGTFAKLLVGLERVVATDVDDWYLDRLSMTFHDCPNVAIRKLDLASFRAEDFRAERIDSVLCINVLEHVEDDGAALRRLHELLPTGGRLVLFVPASPALFGEIDRKLGHYRRYTREGLRGLVKAAGFRVVEESSMNLVGMLGWFVKTHVLEANGLSRWDARVFDLLVPLLRLEDRVKPAIGLSIICVGEKVI